MADGPARTSPKVNRYTLKAPQLQPEPLGLSEESRAYTGMMQAIVAIFREEGLRGFSRGVQARMLIHAPSVAICWTTYESIKSMLQKLGYF